jgi:regulator of ribonuclease activity A
LGVCRAFSSRFPVNGYIDARQFGIDLSADRLHPRSFAMHYITPDLCDAHPELVQVVEPMFSNFGGRDSFGGEIVTVKCFEDNSVVKSQADQPGKGKVLVVDGGGSLRRALLGDMIAEKAAKNGWEGMVIYGCVRDVDVLAQTNLGVQALASHPMKTDKRGIGDLNVVVTFAGVTFRPGEFIYADNNGVIVSPSALQMSE